jgi:mannose-6-phosphate isomerase class I
LERERNKKKDTEQRRRKVGEEKKREKERQAAGKTRKSKRTQTPLAHHNFNVIVFVRQEARESCFLVFCFIFCKTGSAGFFHSVPAARTLGTVTFFSLLTPVGGKDLQVFLP